MAVELVSAEKAVAALTSRMRRLARTGLQLDSARAELNCRLEAVKALYEPHITTLEAAVSRQTAGVEQFCRAQREVLMPGEPKSIRTPYGRAGFRRGAPQVALDERLGEDGVCGALRKRKLNELIRVRESLDRTAVKRALETGEADAKLLAACGICLRQGDESFFCVMEKTATGAGRGQ